MTLPGVKTLFPVLALVAVAPLCRAETPPVDPGLPVYQRVEGVSGKIILTGSDTISQLAAIWSDSFKKLYPSVQVEIQVQGSANAVAAVTEGRANFGLLSRPIKLEEVQAFQKKFNYQPTLLTPALEQIAIYVHKDNPIESLTLPQLDSVFSQSLKRGASKSALTWGDLGLAGEWAATKITCQGRKPDTGSQVFFQAAIMGGGEFRQDLIVNATNAAMVKAIAADPTSIGFGGAIYETPQIKSVPIVFQDGTPAVDVHHPAYRLVRPLQIVVNRPPHEQLSTLENEFLKYIFSQRGQQDVLVGGFMPVPSVPAKIALDAVGLSTLN